MRRLLTWLALFVPFIVTPPTVFGQSNQAAGKAVDLQEIVKFKQDSQHTNFEKLEEGSLAYFQFNQIPDEQKLAELKASGFKLLSYSNDKTYLFAFPSNVKKERLSKFGIVAFAPTKKEQKLAPVVRNNMYPSHAIAADSRVKIAINFHPGFSKERYHFLLEKYDIEVMEDNYGHGNIFTVLMEPTDVDLLSEEPMISFIDVVTPPVELLNNEVRSLQKVTYANAANGYGLNGNGVVVGVGDGGELGDHLDFQDRVINYANGTYSSFGDHGDHVAGIIGGGGIIDAENRGMASEATLLIQKTSLIWYYANDYFYNDNMVLTNNSYGTSFNCTSNGTYNYTSQTLDIQLRQFPEMLHIFAAGNSGAQTCSPYPTSYFTLLKYYQSAKNVLTVGNVTDTRTIKSNSSRGPASDGRLKPEICGIGTSVTSTSRNFDYTTKTGTSMAAPAVTGTMALLYESYKTQNGGSNPSGALMKAIACNTADDLGNAGPDYTYGFGLINARRAVETIIEGRHFTNNISNGGSTSHNITVPANTKQVKVMLYWHDKEAEPNPAKALINDLDLVLSNSSGTDYLPWVLNHDPAQVANLATRSIDTLNNIEQVTIDNPAAGSYTISVAGTEVPSGPQEYYVVYEFVTDDVVLTNPMGGEQLSFSDVVAIQWDAETNNTSTFSVEYSTDGGSSWNTIDANVAATE
ncbi:MAG: S8 family serine peptidase, partial [Saprospiraceae bacterium]